MIKLKWISRELTNNKNSENVIPFAVPRRLQECFLSGLFCFVWFTQQCKGWNIFFENNLRFLRVSELKGFPNVHSEVGGWKKVFSENSQFWERTEGSSAYPNHSLESDEILKILSYLIRSLSSSEFQVLTQNLTPN